jgi:serine/threonine-protein kinase HipA
MNDENKTRFGAGLPPTFSPPLHRQKKNTPFAEISQGIDLSTSVENEWLCAQIVRAYGIEVASCQMETFGEFKTLVVERFDRRLAADGKWYLRLPQEDLC